MEDASDTPKVQEKPSLSPEEIQRNNAQRAERDKQLVLGGAKYVLEYQSPQSYRGSVDASPLHLQERLVVTDEQIKDARVEMSKDRKVIEFPKDIDRVTALQKKLAEYETRISEDRKLSPEVLRGYLYRVEILTQLLTYGDVDLQKLTDELTRQDPNFNVEQFDSAAGIVLDYVETGDAHVTAGTGLPAK